MNIYEMINTPCRELKKLDDKEKLHIAREVACYYQSKGFPYFELTEDEIKDIVERMCNYDVNKLELENDELQQNMLGLNLVNFYHPQMWEVQCNNSRSPIEVFWNTELLTKAIYKRINNSNTKLQPFNIRKAIQVFGGYRVSNFRPTIAKYIYEKYCPENGRVLDPCAGYGGRLFGALSSFNVREYIGVDPDKRQIGGNARMVQNIMPYIPNKHFIDIQLIALPFEDFSFEPHFDLIFTSPPYFDKEKYSNDDTQSYIRYPTYEEWKDGFLYTLISNSYCALRNGGHFAINVAGNDIIHDTVEYSTNLFGSTPETKKMRLSRVLGSHNPNKFKLEPIYIWRKQ